MVRESVDRISGHYTKTLALLSGLINVDFGRNDGSKLNKQVVEICITEILWGQYPTAE